MLEELLQVRSIVEIFVFAFVFYIVLNFVRGTPAAAMLKGMTAEGIVAEAMVEETPVIGSNLGGTTDYLKNGENRDL